MHRISDQAWACRRGEQELEFDQPQIEEAVRAGQLLAIEIELPTTGDVAGEGLEPAEVIALLQEAKALGAAKGFLHGGPIPSGAAEVGIEVVELGRPVLSGGPRVENRRNRCRRPLYSCFVRSQGDVLPCAGLDLVIGNLRRSSLSRILAESEVVEELRDIKRLLRGPCRSCEESSLCVGCRGAAYALTGDHRNSDPSCIRNRSRLQEIQRLPLDARRLAPQRAPMLIIESLLSIGERTAETSATVEAGMPFLDESGSLDEVAYVELMAQSVAAFNGLKYLGLTGAPLTGFLLGVRQVEIHGRAAAGEVLRIRITKTAQFGDFAVIQGSVQRGHEVLAHGELKIWHDSGAERRLGLP